jgi:hypothetical protein
MIVRFVEIDGMFDHYCLNFVFIISGDHSTLDFVQMQTIYGHNIQVINYTGSQL